MSVGGGNEPTQSSCAVILMVSPGILDNVGEDPSLTLVCFCFQTGVRGAEVEQSPSTLSLHEETSSALRCNFSTTMRSVQWFRQNPGGSLISLFFMAPGTKENGRLKSTFDSKERYSTLHIRDAQLGDSGTYLCAADAQCSQQVCSLAPNFSCVCSSNPDTRRLCRRLCTAVALSDLYQLQGSCVIQGEQVEQHPSTLRVQEGSSAVINCTYEDNASSYFPWYKQGPGEHPQLIIDIRSNVERKQEQRLIVLHDKKAKHFSLHITDTQLGDSALYFCAASAHCSTCTCRLSSNLPQGLEPIHILSQAFSASFVSC
ncbi:hypothetical protein STEG23_025905 [Scotinomys teguina]